MQRAISNHRLHDTPWKGQCPIGYLIGVPHFEQSPANLEMALEPWIHVLESDHGIGGKSPPFAISPKILQVFWSESIEAMPFTWQFQVLIVKEYQKFVYCCFVSLLWICSWLYCQRLQTSKLLPEIFALLPSPPFKLCFSATACRPGFAS